MYSLRPASGVSLILGLSLLVAHSLDAAVIAHWTFNEESGNVALDSSGNGNHGAIAGGAAYVSTPGLSGISLDGVDDMVNFGQPALLDWTDEARTIECWVAINDQGPGNNYGIFGKSAGSWILGYEHNGGAAARHKVFVTALNGQTAAEGPVGSALPYGSWHHMLLTKSAIVPGQGTDPVQLYIDGNCVGVCDSGGRDEVVSEAVDVVAGLGYGNFLNAVIDEIIVHDIRMNPSQAQAQFSAGPSTNSPASTPPGRLNNLVTELLNLDPGDISQTNQFVVPNPRKGWIFVSSTAGSLGAGDGAQISLQGPPVDTMNDHQPGEPQTLEAMRWLDAGDHTITLQTQGTAAVQSLIVRAIPELMMWRYVASTQLPQQVPVWDWANLKKHILPSMNTINATRAVVEELRPQHQAFIDEWNAEGKRWLTIGLVPAYQFGPTMTTQQAYDFWAVNAAYNESDWGGLVIDEFGVGDFPDSQYTQMREALEQLTTNFPDTHFYGFAVHIMTANEPGDFMQAIVANEGAILWEWYEREEPNEASAQNKLDAVFSVGMQQWRSFIPNAPSEMGICFGYYSTPPLSLNENPAVDYKVWMDMQFNQVANDPRFDGLRALMEWNTKYTDEEVLRWQAALYRHYGIEGNTARLSDTYGFTYNPGHLTNPDFDQGTSGWTIQQAESGSTGSDTYTGLGRLQGRVRGSTRGDNYLWMRRSAQAPNRVIQTIQNLVPGNLYTMKMFTEDRQDYLNGFVDGEVHAVEIQIDNVVMIPGRAFQEVMQSERGQEVNPPFSSSSQPWFNYYWRLFQAQGTTATLTISDWASAGSPGGPVGQELMFNFIEVQPYFAIGDEIAISETVILDTGVSEVTGVCFTSEVGKVYRLESADQVDGPYAETGATLDGTGGVECLLDPNHPDGFDPVKQYRVKGTP